MKNFKKNPVAENNETQHHIDAENNQDLTEEKTENSVENSEEYQKLLEENAKLKNEFLRAYADADNSANIIKGVEMTEAELSKVFGKFGIKKMEIMDTVFDPNFHQVIQEVEDPNKPAGTIIAELQTGYMINDRILREAMVVVTKGGK